MIKKPVIYYHGDSVNIGLSWQDLSAESVDVSGATDIVVEIEEVSFKRSVLTFKKSDGTMTVSEDKCLITLSSSVTEELKGEYYVKITITSGGESHVAVADRRLIFL